MRAVVKQIRTGKKTTLIATKIFLFHKSDYETQRYLLELESNTVKRYMVKDRLSVLTYTPHVVINRQQHLGREDEYKEKLKDRILSFLQRNDGDFTDIIWEKRIHEYMTGKPHDTMLAVLDPLERFRHILRAVFLLKKKNNYRIVIVPNRLAFNCIVYDDRVMIASPMLAPGMGPRSIVLIDRTAVEGFTKYCEELVSEAKYKSNEETASFLLNLCLEYFQEIHAAKHIEVFKNSLDSRPDDWGFTESDWKAELKRISMV